MPIVLFSFLQSPQDVPPTLIEIEQALDEEALISTSVQTVSSSPAISVSSFGNDAPHRHGFARQSAAAVFMRPHPNVGNENAPLFRPFDAALRRLGQKQLIRNRNRELRPADGDTPFVFGALWNALHREVHAALRRPTLDGRCIKERPFCLRHPALGADFAVGVRQNQRFRLFSQYGRKQTLEGRRQIGRIILLKSIAVNERREHDEEIVSIHDGRHAAGQPKRHLGRSSKSFTGRQHRRSDVGHRAGYASTFGQHGNHSGKAFDRLRQKRAVSRLRTCQYKAAVRRTRTVCRQVGGRLRNGMR